MPTATGHLPLSSGQATKFSWSIKPFRRTIRVLTVDEHALVREGLASIINGSEEMEVVATASTGAEAIRRSREYRPHIVTIDLLLSDMKFEEVISTILSECPGTKIVVITDARGDVHLLRALDAGVRGLVLKGQEHREVLNTIRQVHAGRKVISHQVADMLAEHFGEESLTPREVEVLDLVANGNQNKHVAVKLNISEQTVRMHMTANSVRLIARTQ